MPTTKEFDIKLHSLRNTAKMTRTMKLVSMSKLYRAQEAQKNAKLYAHRLTDLIHRLSASVKSTAHPLLTPHKKIDNVLILLVTSNKGLCGSYNNAINKTVHTWITENKDKYQKLGLSVCGKRGFMSFKNHLAIEKYYEGVTEKVDSHAAGSIADELREHFTSGTYHEVYLAYNIYHNPLSQTPKLEKILPIAPKVFMEGGSSIPPDYIFEPPKQELLEFLIPKYLYFRIYFALLENAAGEHSARMIAMESATKNAQDLIDKYTLLRNRARQAGITKELIEIVSGAEALK